MRETLAEARRADRVSSRSADLEKLVESRAETERKIARTVAGLRRDGLSWEKIAGILGTSKQAAQQRYSSM